jgi:magnesium-transporting ATPase (P-type)
MYKITKGGNMEYKFKGSLTLQDYIQCCKILNRKRIIVTTILAYILFIAFIFLSFSLADIKTIFNNPINLFYIISDKYVIICFLFITLFFVITNFIISPIMYKRNYKADKLINAERNFCITDKLITMSTEDISLHIPRDKIKKIIFDKDAIYIFTSINNVVMIKERYLSDNKEFEALKMFINEKYNENWRGMP